jgi:hypothetical protein
MAPIEFSLCNPFNIDVLLDNYQAEKSFQKLEERYITRLNKRRPVPVSSPVL